MHELRETSVPRAGHAADVPDGERHSGRPLRRLAPVREVARDAGVPDDSGRHPNRSRSSAGAHLRAHNDKRIPRAAIRVYGSTLSGSVSSPSVLTSVPNVFGRVLRQGVGVFDVEVNLSEYFADAVPFGVGLGGNLRIVTPTTIYPNREPPARCVSRASSSTVEPAAASSRPTSTSSPTSTGRRESGIGEVDATGGQGHPACLPHNPARSLQGARRCARCRGTGRSFRCDPVEADRRGRVSRLETQCLHATGPRRFRGCWAQSSPHATPPRPHSARW